MEEAGLLAITRYEHGEYRGDVCTHCEEDCGGEEAGCYWVLLGRGRFR